MTSSKFIKASTSIDGGNLVTLIGASLAVHSGVTMVLANLTLVVTLGNEGTLTVANSVVAGQSGASSSIGNGGTVTLTDSTLSGNSAYLGGVISNGGILDICNCQVLHS